MDIKTRERIERLACDDKFRKFTSALIPGVDNILGVRMGELKKIAKELACNPYDLADNLKEKDIYFEETMVRGLSIGFLRGDINEIISKIKGFIPRINNWAVCDSFCANLKITRKYKEEMWKLIEMYAISERTYEARFAIVLALDYFIEDNYIQDVFNVLERVKSKDYYVQMAIAWAVSICFINDKESTIKYLVNNHLDNWTLNKSIQKIRESKRVSTRDKEDVLTYKR
ncbi:MAG: DNA alkylation repair protein [Anaerovoracaceae bacterium]